MPNHPTDTDNATRIDEHRMAHLDDVGAPGYDAVVAITADGEEHLVLAWREGLTGPSTYWPDDWRKTAPHELTGRVPKGYAPTCGRIASSSGKPCKTGVRMWGNACPRHAHIDAERIQPV